MELGDLAFGIKYLDAFDVWWTVQSTIEIFDLNSYSLHFFPRKLGHFTCGIGIERADV